MPEIKDARALFVHQLGEALNMERTVVTMLKRNREAARDAEVEQLFADHLAETEGQRTRLRAGLAPTRRSKKASRYSAAATCATSTANCTAGSSTWRTLARGAVRSAGSVGPPSTRRSADKLNSVWPWRLSRSRRR